MVFVYLAYYQTARAVGGSPTDMQFGSLTVTTPYLSELFGTYLLVLLGAASVVVAPYIGFQNPDEALAFIAFIFGITVAGLIVILGKRSGSMINPAITFATGVEGSLRREMVAPYIVFQLAGGLLAGLSLKAVFGSFASAESLGSSKLAQGVTPIEGILLEATGTFVLAVSALAATAFVRSQAKQAIIVGLTLFVLIMLIGPFTTASFNPARSLGPSLFSGYFDNQIVYWVGPILGGTSAGLFFEALRKTGRLPRARGPG